MIGAFLRSPRPNANPRRSDEISQRVKDAAKWLIRNNSLYRDFSIREFRRKMHALPIAEEVHSCIPVLFHNYPFSEMVLDPSNYHHETHNQDFHWRRLVLGKERLPNGHEDVAMLSDINSEAKLYPWLYPYGRGHFIRTEESRPRIDTLCQTKASEP
jgi:hypothetical protein